MSPVVVDSSALVALLDVRDSLHARAIDAESGLREKVPRIFPDVVVTESIGVLARRSHEQRRPDAFPPLLKSLRSALPPSRILWVSSLSRSYYGRAMDLIAKHGGLLNFNDCLIALFMRDNGLSHFLSFDADFDLLPHIHRISSRSEAQAVQE